MSVFDEQSGQWISDAQIAETPYTIESHRTHQRIHGRLIVRRVRDLNPHTNTGDQQELFCAYRYHTIFTDNPAELQHAESQHRGHAIVEHVFADLLDGPLAHLPSATFTANAAWLQLATIAHTLTRALGALASPRHAVARGATIRTELINVAARPARSGRNTITWHLPQHWPWQGAWLNAFHATRRAPPLPAAA
jgi:DDE family transposase